MHVHSRFAQSQRAHVIKTRGLCLIPVRKHTQNTGLILDSGALARTIHKVRLVPVRSHDQNTRLHQAPGLFLIPVYSHVKSIHSTSRPITHTTKLSYFFNHSKEDSINV